MKIVFVSKECPPSPRSSGIGTYVWETGRALVRHGHEVTIVAASDDGKQEEWRPEPGLTVVRLPDDEQRLESRSVLVRTLIKPTALTNAYRRRIVTFLDDLNERWHPDVIEFPGFRGEGALWCSSGHRVPMIVRMHGFTAGIESSWKDHVSATRRNQLTFEQREFQAADAITVVAHHLAKPVAARFGPSRVRVVYNSIDAEWWANNSEMSSNVSVTRNDILFAGGLTKKKGIMALVRASELLRNSGWRGRLLIAGRSSREFRLFVRGHWAFRAGLPDWIVELGQMNREHLGGLYKRAGTCCFPSLSEPFGYTCAEAMACGAVVVGSLDTGMAEIIISDCGFLTRPGDILGISQAISKALALGGAERRRIGGAASKRIRDFFDHSVVIPRLLAVYQQTIARFRQ